MKEPFKGWTVTENLDADQWNPAARFVAHKVGSQSWDNLYAHPTIGEAVESIGNRLNRKLIPCCHCDGTGQPKIIARCYCGNTGILDVTVGACCSCGLIECRCEI